MQQNKNEFTISKLLIICASVIAATICICGVFILVAVFNSDLPKKDKKEETKLEDISILVDGLSFTLKQKFGDTVRQIANQRQPYWFDTTDARDMVVINDVETFLNKPYKNTRTQVEWRNRIGTYFNVTATSENDGKKHGDDYKIADSTASLSFNVRGNESAYIDNLRIQANQTDRDDLRSMFKEIEIQEEDNQYGFATHVAQYKGRKITITYQNGIISISINPK